MPANNNKDPIPKVLGNWWLNETLGSGYSGYIFRAQHLHTRQTVALKVQHIDHECPTNRYERHLYPLLQGGKGMPTLWASGVAGIWDYLAIDLLGASLDNLYKKSGKDTMDLGSVCTIAMQLISRLETMHARGVLHRDIQLGNCVIGLPPNEGTIYMIDFGFSKRYIDPHTRRHIPDSKAKRDFIGNYWFSSVGVHCRGKVPSRRDDLEAAALMFIHLLTPRGLTWTRNGIPKTDYAHNRLKQEKRNATPEDLCKGLPSEFEEFLRYCRRLKFQETPNYAMWIEEFRALAVEQGYPDDDTFVWPPRAPQGPVKTTNTPRRNRTPALEPDQWQGILSDLRRLDLAGRPVLGDKTNIEEAVRRARDDAKKDDDASEHAGKEIITISSGSEEDKPIPSRNKAYRLMDLANKMSKATNNLALSEILLEFIEVLQCNSSRTLTREAFHFLDMLYKQLADPAVFVTPLRTSRQRSNREQEDESRDAPHIKRGVVARLRKEVSSARSTRSMAEMVAEFGKVTNKSTGRTITKDGFAFLKELSDRLKVIQPE